MIFMYFHVSTEVVQIVKQVFTETTSNDDSSRIKYENLLTIIYKYVQPVRVIQHSPTRHF